jgi:hypothetical protein
MVMRKYHHVNRYVYYGKKSAEHAPTLLDVLNIMENRLEIVEAQCSGILAAIDSCTRSEIDDQIAIMDAEISRCQKLLSTLKMNIENHD